MKVNLADISYIDEATQQVKFKAINLYPYLMSAVDIYVLCESTEKYNWLMSPSYVFDAEGGTTNSITKMTIIVDGNKYDIEPSSPGASPTNPITYQKENADIVLVSDNGAQIGYIGSPEANEYSERQVEKDENIGDRNIGTSILSANDGVSIDIKINDQSLLIGEKFPFGGAKSDSELYDGFGGAIVDTEGLITPVEGFGGVPPNKYLQDIVIIIEKSKFKDNLSTRDVVNNGAQSYGIRY